MEKYLDRAGLSVSAPLVQLIESEALTGTGISADAFWKGAAKIFATLAPENTLAAFANATAMGVDTLELRVGCKGNGFGAHAVWLDPVLVGPDPAAIRRAADKN